VHEGRLRRGANRSGGQDLPQTLLQVFRLQNVAQPQQLRAVRGGALLQERLSEERHRQKHPSRHVTHPLTCSRGLTM